MASRQSISASFTVRYAAEGTGIASVATYYALSTSATTVTGSWSTTCPTMTEDYPYLWQYTVTVYTDGDSDTTDAVLIGHFGADGADGQDGADGADGADGPSYTFTPSSVTGTSDGYEYSGSLSATLAAYDTDGNEVTISAVEVKSCSDTTDADKTTASTSTVSITPASRSVDYGSSTGVTSGSVTASYTSGYVVLAITVNGSVFRHTITWSIECAEAISTAYYGSSGISLLYTTVSDVESGLLATGIDITNKKIIATANSFIVQNNSNDTVMSIQSDVEYAFSGTITRTVDTAIVFSASSFVIQNSDGDAVITTDGDGLLNITYYGEDDDGNENLTTLQLGGYGLYLSRDGGPKIRMDVSGSYPEVIGLYSDGTQAWGHYQVEEIDLDDASLITGTIDTSASSYSVDSSGLKITYTVAVTFTNSGSASATISSSTAYVMVDSAFGQMSLKCTTSLSSTLAAGSSVTLIFTKTETAKSSSATFATETTAYAYYNGSLLDTATIEYA